MCLTRHNGHRMRLKSLIRNAIPLVFTRSNFQRLRFAWIRVTSSPLGQNERSLIQEDFSHQGRAKTYVSEGSMRWTHSITFVSHVKSGISSVRNEQDERSSKAKSLWHRPPDWLWPSPLGQSRRCLHLIWGVWGYPINVWLSSSWYTPSVNETRFGSSTRGRMCRSYGSCPVDMAVRDKCVRLRHTRKMLKQCLKSIRVR